jgi:hypothetical protein
LDQEKLSKIYSLNISQQDPKPIQDYGVNFTILLN